VSRRASGTHDGGDGPWSPQASEVTATRRAALAAPDDLSAGVHEVQNALASALFSVDVARRSPDPIERSRALGTIERTIERAREMLSALADPERRFRVCSAPFRMAAVLDEIAALLRPRCEAAGVRLHVQVDGDPKAWGDSERILQILTNLVLNALDAVQALQRRAAQRGVISLVARERADSGCEFVVTDDGSGMSPETLARVFEPGFTTHPRAEGPRKAGTGYGMSISRMLAQAMGGDLVLRSTEGRGTEAFVLLPRGDLSSAPVPSGERGLGEDDALPVGLRVLVVDDEPSIRDLLETALSLRGATVRAVSGVCEAREALGEDRFDVVLVDESLGAAERGTVLVEELLDQRPDAIALLMTGAPSVDHLPARVSRSVLRKPFSLDEVVQSILRAREGEPEASHDD
jgi:CheY-like chemotaxis protein